MEKIRDVLTEGAEREAPGAEGRAQGAASATGWRTRIANLKDLNLTDDQKTQIADIRKEYRPKVHEAGNKLRATVREEVEAILAVIKG